MQLNKAIEIVFTIVILLFLAVFVMGILIGISIFQELSDFEIDKKFQFIFVFGMAAVWLYIMRMIALRIRDYHRYI